MTEKKEPFKKVLSENVEVYYGWKDGHVKVRARLPLPLKPWWPMDVPAKDVKVFRQTFRGASDFGEGKSSLALVDPIEIEVREDCKVTWGFKDRHLELRLKRLGVWLPFNFTLEELKLGLQALNEASAWAECSTCKKQTSWAFEVLEDVPGKRPVRRNLCFPCISDLGDRIMTEYRKARMAEEESRRQIEAGEKQ
jgi:hypothetical protein